MVGVEYDLNNHRFTGKMFIKVISDRSVDTFRAFFYDYVRPGSEIWTDSLPSYQFLTSLGFEHFTMNHRAGELTGSLPK